METEGGNVFSCSDVSKENIGKFKDIVEKNTVLESQKVISRSRISALRNTRAIVLNKKNALTGIGFYIKIFYKTI